MKLKLKYVAIAELVIIVLLVWMLTPKYSSLPTVKDYSQGLLSPRVYAGIIEPKSLLVLNYAPLRRSLDEYIKKNNLSISLYLENLRSGASMGIKERKGYPPASLNKVAVAILVMKKIERKELKLDSLLDILDSQRDESFGDLYNTADKKLSVDVLMVQMLEKSDNTAFNVLNAQVDPKDLGLLQDYNDYYSEESVNKTKPNEDYSTGLVTPKSMYNVFASLYLSTMLEPNDSEYILQHLTHTVFDVNRIAQLPPTVKVAQKFGDVYHGQEKYLHSCGILYDGDRRFFYCVMTEGLAKEEAQKQIGFIVHEMYNYSLQTRKYLDESKEE